MSHGEVRVYTPARPLRRPLDLLREMLKDVAASRELAWRLAVRDVSAQYRQAALGFLWVFLLPVANTVIWTFLRRTGVVAMEGTAMPYVAFVFSGTVLWAVFSDAVNAPLQQATAARAMLVKINFPREALILSGILQVLFNGTVRVAVLLAALLLLGIVPGWTLVLFPAAFLSLVLIGTTVGLFLAPVGMLYTDVARALPLALQFLMYLAPVVFPAPAGGLAGTVFRWNPLTPVIEAGRGWLAGMPADLLMPLLVVDGIFVLLLAAMAVAYRLSMPILIERLGS